MPMPRSADTPSTESHLRRLHNQDWGFESNCFVCEPRNDGGLRIPFHHATDRDVVVATFTLGNRFSGAPSYVHGGVTLAVLDEAMAWAAIAIGGKLAVTTETTTRFHRPVLVDKTYTVEARITAQNSERIDTTARVTYGDSKVCAEAAAIFAILGEAQAARAAGVDVSTLRADVVGMTRHDG